MSTFQIGFSVFSLRDLAQRVAGEAPQTVRHALAVAAQPLRTWDLADLGQVLVRLPRVVEVAEHPDLGRVDAGDAQVVGQDERTHPATAADERNVDDGYPRPEQHLVGPDVGPDAVLRSDPPVSVRLVRPRWLRRGHSLAC